MLHVLEQALAYGQKQQADRLAGQASIFDSDFGAAESTSEQAPPAGLVRRSSRSPTCCGWRRRRSASTSPSTRSRRSAAELRAKTDATIAELERRRDGENVVVGGIVSEVKQMTTKRGEPMVFMRLDDVTGGIECVVFDSTYAAAARALRHRPDPDRKGRVDHKEGETKLLASRRSPRSSRSPSSATVRLRIDATQGAGGHRSATSPTLLRDFPGESPVLVDCVTSQGPLVLRLGPRFCVQPGGGLLRRGAGAARRVGARAVDLGWLASGYPLILRKSSP